MPDLLKITLPFEDPILIFTLIVIVILLTPIAFRKLNIPGIVGLILAGVIIGPHGFNILLRDSGIILFGTVGLLYIMFLSGLEMNLEEFRKNLHKSIGFGIVTFIIPQGAGTLIAYYLLGLPLASSILLASMFASHTLLSYPIVSKLGLIRSEAATITFGGTLITNTLALLVLSVIVAFTVGELTGQFWIILVLYSVGFGVIIFAGIPRISSWFFRNFEGEGVSHYLFVLAVIFGSSFLAGVFRLEAIIGAFVAGLALNRLIPPTSPLMNRIEFVGNALFIPFFLIGTGMIVDVGIIFKDPSAIGIAIAMISIATASKWTAAFITQKMFGYSPEERNLIFGLSNAQAASTLAAVVIGHNIGLFSESILNGTILMIFVTCLISSVATDRAGRKMVVRKRYEETDLTDTKERIMVPVSNPATIGKLMDLAFYIRKQGSHEPVYPLTVIVDKGSRQHIAGKLAEGKQMLETALKHGSSVDFPVQMISKVDLNIPTGIIRASKEMLISDIVIGWNGKLTTREKVFGSILDIIVQKTHTNILVYKPSVPLNTTEKIILVTPDNAEFEKGFNNCLSKVVHLSNQIKAPVLIYGPPDTMRAIELRRKALNLKKKFSFNSFETWSEFTNLTSGVTKNDLLIVFSGRKGSISYTRHHDLIPKLLSKYFTENGFIILFPEISYSRHEVDSNLQMKIPGYLSVISRKIPGKKLKDKLFKSKYR